MQLEQSQQPEEPVGIAHVLSAENETSDIVWHYTNDTGLLGILENNCLWASNVNFLNDVAENKKAKQLLHDNILKRVSIPDIPAYERVLNQLGKDDEKEFDYTLQKHSERLGSIRSSAGSV
jgi:hypothetical protein